MKLLTVHAAAIAALLLVAGCSKTSVESAAPGSLTINIAHDPATTTVSAGTRSETPDVSDFTVDILQGGSTIKRYSPIGASSKSVTLEEGVYTISVYSEVFTAPLFENPVYGVSEDFTIVADDENAVSVTCVQTNAGIRIGYGEDFKAEYDTYSTRVTHSSGSLNFTGENAEKAGYFPTGNVDVEITADGKMYNSSLTLLPRTDYNITIDRTPVESGEEMAVTISISTTVDNENVTIYFPNDNSLLEPGQREVIYFENFGDTETMDGSYLPGFNGWRESDVTYGGSDIDIYPGCEANYEGSSKGNYGTMLANGSSMTITGIDCSGYRSLILTIGTNTDYSTFDKNK